MRVRCLLSVLLFVAVEMAETYEVTQPKWEAADWKKLDDYVDGTTDDTSADKPTITHRHLEDLRKRIWLLWNPGAGHYVDWDNAALWEQLFDDTPTGDYGKCGMLLKKWGLEYTTGVGEEDEAYERWILSQDVTNAQHALPTADAPYGENKPPPDPYHSAASTWSNGQHWWLLWADWNKYHHFDVNSQRFKCSRETETWGSEAFIHCYTEAAFKCLPWQTDPIEQLRPIVYLDNAKDDWQYKGKVAVRQWIISQPSAMGAVFDFRTGWTRASDDANTPTIRMVRNKQLVYANQYGHTGKGQSTYAAGYGGQVGTSGDSNSDLNPATKAGRWQGLFNPKVNYAYQCQIEAMLSCQSLRLPYKIGSTDWAGYASNWNARRAFCWDDGKTWVNTDSLWENLVSVRDPELGCNESGFEAFLAYMQASNVSMGGTTTYKHDWYFDTQKPYICWDSAAIRADRAAYSGDANCWAKRFIANHQPSGPQRHLFGGALSTPNRHVAANVAL